MASTITLNADKLPEGAKSVKFLVGNESFDLDANGKHETDDVGVISTAQDHPWLTVKFDEPKNQEAPAKKSEAQPATPTPAPQPGVAN